MKDYDLIVESNIEVAEQTFRMRLNSSNLPPIKSGQFLHIETGDKSNILRRPFCVFNAEQSFIEIIYQLVGSGTRVLSQAKCGDKLKALLPLGNYFELGSSFKRIALVGGGVGCAPLYMLPKQQKLPSREFFAFLGFSTANRVILEDEFKESCSQVFITTDDGSKGFSGRVTQKLIQMLDKLKIDCIVCGGNHFLLKAVQSLAAERNLKGFITGEERMGCGVGACLVCTCKVLDNNAVAHSQRMCADGPVFELDRIVL